jgi:FkbM family methyltransferase
MELNKFKYPMGDEGNVGNFYREIFLENEYNRHGVGVEQGDVVFDLGAYVGMFSHYALAKGAKHVYAIEADRERYNYLVENTKDYPQITTYNAYVSDRTNRGDMKLSRDNNNPEHYSVDKLMMENNIATVDFIKMDIEGWEYPSLMNMSNKTLSSVNKWAIEVHLEWVSEGKDWGYGMDFDEHRVNKLLYIMDKFTCNGFKLAYERIHKEYNIAMLYAIK